MRYSIMLQVATLIALTLLGAAAGFAWLQNRPVPGQSNNARTYAPDSKKPEVWMFFEALSASKNIQLRQS